VLVLLNFDSASLPLLERLVAEDRLPHVADLLERGRRYELETPATYFPAATYPTLYTGLELGAHGLYYPFQWNPREQRTRFRDFFGSPPAVWELAGATGARTLVVDPYEAAPPQDHRRGLVLSGWQFQNRVVLPAWSTPPDAHRRLRRRLGAPPRVEEVFGAPSPATLEAMRRNLLAAPGRVARVAADVLAREQVDLAWLTFSAAHLAGHQFWDLSTLDDDALGPEARTRLSSTLPEVYERVDAAVGQILESVAADAGIVLFSALGMGPNTSRVDFLPGMLAAVLAGGPLPARDRSPGSSLWRLRAAVPTQVRAAVADAVPRRAVLELTSRFETRAADWSCVRAFALASDAVGYVRLNLRGRERDGVVEPEAADALLEKIAAGLASFRDPDGEPAVAETLRIGEIAPDAARADLLPDLVVRWGRRSATRIDFVASPQFGEVPRAGRGSGRSGNHTDDAWAVVVPGRYEGSDDARTGRVTDIGATVCATLGGDATGLAGRPLLAA
jgi:predicted AlkP superfamily phosphohydrolase/phosphomutase